MARGASRTRNCAAILPESGDLRVQRIYPLLDCVQQYPEILKLSLGLEIRFLPVDDSPQICRTTKVDAVLTDRGRRPLQLGSRPDNDEGRYSASKTMSKSE